MRAYSTAAGTSALQSLSRSRHLLRLALSGYDRGLRLKNRGRRRLLIYTDSRGRNVVGRTNTHYEGSYVHDLQRSQWVLQSTSPYSHTTIVDFLNDVESLDPASFDAVVLHCGVVDFSPRPLSNIAKVKAGKRGRPEFEEMFRINAEYHANPWPVQYEGEPTINLYSPEYLRSRLLPRLQAIPNLVWISSNRFVPSWEGNYTRGRPSNIDEVVSRFDAVMLSELPRTVDLRQWSLADVRRYTIDNVHFNRAGFVRVRELLSEAIDL